MTIKTSAAAALAVALAATSAGAQPPATPAPTPTSAPAAASFGSHQIDRFEAIRLLQQSTAANPKAAPDWVILGELSHEAALDVPSGQDATYYKISRDAYEHAAALAPDNAGLKAAVQFARDQEAGAPQFDASRKASARTYIATRRQELATSGLNPDRPGLRATPCPRPGTAHPRAGDDPDGRLGCGPAQCVPDLSAVQLRAGPALYLSAVPPVVPLRRHPPGARLGHERDRRGRLGEARRRGGPAALTVKAHPPGRFRRGGDRVRMSGMSDQEPPGPPPQRGRFFALDGPDGGGKSTQAARLVARLRDLGFQVVACRDPGGTPLGERLRPILLDRSDAAPGLRAEMLLYMASRAQLVDEVIRPALEAGKVVIADRFLLANLVYQGFAGGLPLAEIWGVARAATGGLLPDLTLVVDVPVEVGRARTGGARDRIEDRPAEYQAGVRTGFLEVAQSYPAPVVVVDGAAAEDVVAASLWGEVARVLEIGPRA